MVVPDEQINLAVGSGEFECTESLHVSVKPAVAYPVATSCCFKACTHDVQRFHSQKVCAWEQFFILPTCQE